MAVLGKTPHSNVKENISLCGRLYPEAFIDQVVLLQSVPVYFLTKVVAKDNIFLCGVL